MAKDALIKLRCSRELKDRLEAIARRREQSLSDYIRTRLIEVLPELEAGGRLEEPRESYGSNPAEPVEQIRREQDELRRRRKERDGGPSPDSTPRTRRRSGGRARAAGQA